MNQLLSIISPITGTLVVLLILLAILRLLQRDLRLRALTPIYLIGTVLLVLASLLDDYELLQEGLVSSLLLAALLLCWGYIIFDVVEYMLVERVLMQRGVVVPRLARDILRGLVLIGLILLVISTIFNIPLNSLVISSTVVSAVLGLALQDLLRNVIAGIALQAERPFGVGDWIQHSGQAARVVEMSWRATHLVTLDNNHIMVPNATLAQAEINNFSSVSPLQALHIQIPLAPHHPPNEVKRLMAKAALDAEGVLAEPPPRVRLVTTGQDSVTYDIKLWLNDFARHVDIRDAVMTRTWYALRRAGFGPPHPIREVFLHEADPRRSADQRMSQCETVRAALHKVEFLAMLAPDEIDALAERATLQIFGAGETLVRQGDRDDGLYVLRRGRVRVEVDREGDQGPITVNRLGPGEILGELSLLTGEPRTASVVAEIDTEAVKVRHEALVPLLAQNQSLPAQLSAVLERRAAQTRSVLAEHATSAPTNGETANERGLLGRIMGIVGLDPAQKRDEE